MTDATELLFRQLAGVHTFDLKLETIKKYYKFISVKTTKKLIDNKQNISIQFCPKLYKAVKPGT